MPRHGAIVNLGGPLADGKTISRIWPCPLCCSSWGDASAAHADASRQLADERDLAMPKAWSKGMIEWCAAENGDAGRGVVLLTEAIAELHAAHSRHFMPYLLGLMAEAQIKLGNIAASMKAVE